MHFLRLIAFGLALVASAAQAQVNPGTSPLSGKKGGTNNAFMQFSGPASSMKTYTLANASDTIAMLGQIQTWTGAQSLSDGKLILLGSSSGSVTLHAPATGGVSATFFPGTDTVVGAAATQTLTNKTFVCANQTSCVVRLGSDVSGLLPLANIVAGTQDTILGYFGSTAVSAIAPGNCANALTYSTSTHSFGCNSIAGTGTVTTAGTGLSLSGGGSTLNLALTNATLQVSPSNPAGTVSATAVMMGLGATCKITPVYGSRVLLDFQGSGSNTGSGTSFTVQARFGTSTAPTNGAGVVGTTIGTSIIGIANPANFVMPFKAGGIITGLTPGTAYWFDLSLTSSGGTTATIENIGCTAVEL